MISFIRRCHETATKPITIEEVFDAIKNGGQDGKKRINQIRNRYEAEKDITGSVEKARKAIAELKMELPGFLPSGLFSERSNDKLVEYSGILCADLDNLGNRLQELKEIFKALPFVRAVAVSPSGDGLKVFFNVVPDPARHFDSFRSIQDNLRELGVEIDEKCKDLARICFFTYDPDIWVRTEGNEPIPPMEPLPTRTTTNYTPGEITPDMTLRERIACRRFGPLEWCAEKNGYFIQHCPGEYLHTNSTSYKHTMVYLTDSAHGRGPQVSCTHLSCKVVREQASKDLQSEIGKEEWKENIQSTNSYRDRRLDTNLAKPNGANSLAPEKPLIEICTMDELENYVPPDGIQLIGDYHITQDTGFVFVIGGHPSVGKSLAAISLGVAGAKGEGEWFGMKIHRKFKVLIIQTENGMFRLSRIIKDLGCKELRNHLQITKPPMFGLLFRRDDFRQQIARIIEAFAPDIVIIDPWNSVARDQEQVTYLETFQVIRSVLPPDTVLGILAHTRKPQKDEGRSGRSLMHVLAGSHVLSSVPRTIFVLQHASDDVEEDIVVMTCCKNNDGEPGKRTAHRRRPSGIFEPSPNFDWATFDATDKDKRVVITQDMVEEVFEDGQVLLVQARDKLHELSGATKGACYKALSKKGRFSDNLAFSGKFVNWLRS